MTDIIKFGHKDFEVFRFCSNFFKSPFFDTDEDSHLEWDTVEHYYQAEKAVNPMDRQKIWLAKHPAEAKKLGRQVECREDWEEVKEEVMLRALRYKFSSGTNLAEMLMLTGDSYLAEWAPWDEYWGLGKKENGKNRLGHLLMQVRAELFEKRAKTQAIVDSWAERKEEEENAY